MLKAAMLELDGVEAPSKFQATKSFAQRAGGI
jgi:hypothetical protein